MTLQARATFVKKFFEIFAWLMIGAMFAYALLQSFGFWR